MRINSKLLLSLVLLACGPDRVLAQMTNYSCNQAAFTGIDSISTVVGTSAGGVSIVVHWLGNSTLNQFYQFRYALPGGTDTQVKVNGGTEGVYNLVLGPTADPNGTYTFKVQGCQSNVLASAVCAGGPPGQEWDAKNYTISGMPSPPISGQSGTPPLRPGASPTNETPAPACTAGARVGVSPCTCMILNQPSQCDPAETAACLTAAQLARVPKCPGTEYLTCGGLPAIPSRDTGGTWFNRVALNCVKIPVPGTSTPATRRPDGNLPILNQAPTR
jgi:hypothetical protein